MRAEDESLPVWGTVAKWVFVLGWAAVFASRLVDDDAAGAGWAFRSTVSSIAMAALAVWVLAGVVWIVRRRSVR